MVPWSAISRTMRSSGLGGSVQRRLVNASPEVFSIFLRAGSSTLPSTTRQPSAICLTAWYTSALRDRTAVAMSFSEMVSAAPRKLSASASSCRRASNSASFSPHSFVRQASRLRDSASYMPTVSLLFDKSLDAHLLPDSMNIENQLVAFSFILSQFLFERAETSLTPIQLPVLPGQQGHRVARSGMLEAIAPLLMLGRRGVISMTVFR